MCAGAGSGPHTVAVMSLPATALVPLLNVMGDDPTLTFMPFVLLLGPLLLAGLLLFVVGRQRRRKRDR